MKKFFFLLTFVVFSALCAQRAVKFRPAEPVAFQNPMLPLKILDYFARNFPESTPHWGISGNYYSLKFIDTETSLGRAIIYDRDGTIIRFENEVKLYDCPLTLQQYYLENYAKDTPRIWCFKLDDGMRYYFRNRSRTVWFDGQGKHLDEKDI